MTYERGKARIILAQMGWEGWLRSTNDSQPGATAYTRSCVSRRAQAATAYFALAHASLDFAPSPALLKALTT